MKLLRDSPLGMKNAAFGVLRQVRGRAAFFFAYILTVLILTYKNVGENRRGVPIYVWRM